jgi:membrane-bound lytic murein transglycosylase B
LQEDIENRTVTLAVTTSKLTGRVLKDALSKVLAERKRGRDRPPKIPHGKQTVKQLIGQNQGVSNIEITNRNIKSFEQVARKYGVDFAAKKDRSVIPPTYLVFFKARDADALTTAFTEFTQKAAKKASRPSVLKKLQKFKAWLKDAVVDRTRNKEPER